MLAFADDLSFLSSPGWLNWIEHKLFIKKTTDDFGKISGLDLNKNLQPPASKFTIL